MLTECHSACREHNLVKQQQVALRLSKAAAAQEGAGRSDFTRDSDDLLSSERYKWWVVCSVLLQTRAAHQQQQQQQAVAGIAGPGPAPYSAAVAPSGGAAQLLRLAETMIVRLVSKAGLIWLPLRVLSLIVCCIPVRFNQTPPQIQANTVLKNTATLKDMQWVNPNT